MKLPTDIIIENKNCPKCQSDWVSMVYNIPVDKNNNLIHILGNYSEYKCKKCNFESEISFKILNKINERDNKINTLLNGI